jgi:hypothetical protein
MHKTTKLLWVAGAALAVSPTVQGQDDSELARQSQNPVAAIISVPFESNFYYDVGPSGETAWVTNIKPVIPTALGEDINLINRIVAPAIYLESQDAIAPAQDSGDNLGGLEVFPETDSEFGLGNLQYQAFFSPANPGKVIWGAGPVIELPTNTDPKLGSDTWSAGPSVVVLSMPGNWGVGMLAQNIWDFASDSGEPDVNRATIQPILNYNLREGWYLSGTTVITADWEAESGDEWTVPLGGGGGRLVRFGELPVDFKLMAYWNVEKPEFGPDWSAQFTIKFLLPRP